MRVLVCGGRDYDDWDCVCEYLGDLVDHPQDLEIISGMARGADTLAADYADYHGLVLHKFPADWEKYGKRAGYLRNVQMLEEGKPDLVVAFPGGKGTAMMVRLAKEKGIEVLEISSPEYRSERP